MIDEKKIEEWRRWWDNGKGTCPVDLKDVADTLTAALKVVRAAQNVQGYYSNEPRNQALTRLDGALKPFSPPEGEREGGK